MQKSKKKVPVVAIIGRPNVGKSSLFNRILGRRHAIVDPTSGVTRDRLSAHVSDYDKPFRLVDTGGMVQNDDDIFTVQILKQAKEAIAEASAIIFVVDIKEGLTPLDQDIAEILRQADCPIYVAANKADNDNEEVAFGEFYALGYEQVYALSAMHARHVFALMDKVLEALPDVDMEATVESLSIAVVGRPNVGKSSFINKVLNEERVIVSDVPGTTRDAVNITFKRHGDMYTFIDTAGMRYRRKVTDNLEYYSVNRALKSVARSDITLLMIDAEEGLTTLEVKILEDVQRQGKPCVLLINKWDAHHAVHQKEYVEQYLRKLTLYPYIPCVFISAKLGQNIHKVFDAIEAVYAQYHQHVPTPVLNTFFEKLLKRTQPSLRRGKRFKVFYACQVEAKGPTFLISANHADLLDASYKRYIENQLRQTFGFAGVPIRLFIRSKAKAARRKNH